MKKKIVAIGLAVCIALLMAIPISAQAAEYETTPSPAAELSETAVTVRINIMDFSYEMPSGRTPGPIYKRWYMAGTVTNEEGEKIASARSGILWLSESGYWLDLVIWKDKPERGDNLSITLDAITYASGNYIDINSDEVLLKDPYDPTGRRLTIPYVVGTGQEGWGIGGERVLTDFDGELHYKIETIGLSEEPEQTETAKGCIRYPNSPMSIMAEAGKELKLFCEIWNCGEAWGAIEAQIFDADTGETLASNWDNCDAGNKSCTVVTRKDIIVNRNLLLGFQASHWDYEHPGWIRDETKYVTIKVIPELIKIKGNVYDAETGYPVEGATVTCQRGYCKIVDGATICTLCIPPPAEKTTTDSNGYFEFSDLETTWIYSITVKHEHYITKSVEIPLTSEEKSIRIDLQPLSPFSFGVDLSCTDTNKSVSPEERALYTITVQNTGDWLDTINLTIPPSIYPPPPCGWASISLSKYQLTLPPSDSTEVILYVGPFTQYYGSSKTVIVIGTSQGDPTISDSITTITTIIPPTPTTEKLRFVFMIHGDGTMQDGSAADFEKCISDSIKYIESQSPIRIERVDYNVEKAGHYIDEEKNCSWLGGKDIADQYPNFPEGHVHFLFWQNLPPPAPGVCYGGMCFNEWIEKPSYRIPHPLAMVPYRIPKWWWGDCWLGSEKGCACGVTHEIHHVLEYELRKRGYPTSDNLGEHIHGKTVPFADAQSAFGFTDQKAFNDFMWNEITEEMVKSLSPTPTPTPLPKLQSLTIDIEPKSIQAVSGQYVPYSIKIDWSPKEWSGTINTRLKIKGFNIEKEYSFDTLGITPPFEGYKYDFTVPNVPPLTYKILLTATADDISDTTESELTVVSGTPVRGFEAIFAIASLLAVVAYLLRKKK